MPTQGAPVPTIPQPAFNIQESQPEQERFGLFPQFLSVHQLVDVLEGSTAVLECRLANLGIQHTVGLDGMQTKPTTLHVYLIVIACVATALNIFSPHQSCSATHT